MCKTTSPATSSVSVVRRVFPPCMPESNPGKVVKITLYDPKKLIDNRNDLKNALAQVENFYNGLKQRNDIPDNVKQELAGYSFSLIYRSADPGDVELQAMARMDFPLYVFHTPGISMDSTSPDDIRHLMETHNVSSIIFLKSMDDTPPHPPFSPTKDVYNDLEADWASETVLGFGFAGNYYTHGTCRKLGLIKIDALLKNTTGFNSAADKFRSVVEHELGHMLSLTHFAGTIMNDKYQAAATDFSVRQVTIIRDTLKLLSP